MDRHQIEDLLAAVRMMLDKRFADQSTQIKSVGIWQAVVAACVTSALTTGAVMFLWGIFR